MVFAPCWVIQQVQAMCNGTQQPQDQEGQSCRDQSISYSPKLKQDATPLSQLLPRTAYSIRCSTIASQKNSLIACH